MLSLPAVVPVVRLKEFTIVDPSYSMLLILSESSWAHSVNQCSMDIALTVFLMQEIESKGSPHSVQTLSFLESTGSKREPFLPFSIS